MALVPTPHIEALDGEIAESILLPGDPLRAKFIAKTYLDDVKQFNSVRNMLGYTGTYNGKEVSVMGTGMGISSMGIYSYELAKFYRCKKMIRVGTAGALKPEMNIGDVVFAQGACYTCNMAQIFGTGGVYAPICDFELLERAVSYARAKKIKFHVGNVLTSDLYYIPGGVTPEGLSWANINVLAVEMESAVLYLNGATLGAKALSILTVSNSLTSGEETSALQRERAFTDMMEIALNVATED